MMRQQHNKNIRNIRKRISIRDDEKIYEMIEHQLYPYSKNLFPYGEFDEQNEYERLQAGVTFVLAEGEQEPLAFILLNTSLVHDEKTMWIELLAVHSSQQSRGFGSVLVSRAEQYAREQGCTRSKVYVDEDNRRAKRFYEKNRYVHTEYIPLIQTCLFTKSLDI